MDQAGGGVPIAHLGRDLVLIGDEQCPSQGRVLAKGIVDLSRRTRPDFGQCPLLRFCVIEGCSRSVRRRSRGRSDHCRCERNGQREPDDLASNERESAR